MTEITDIATLEALYDGPSENSLRKVTDRLIPAYRRWIERSRFCVLSSVGPGGTDASPRGDDGPVVRALTDRQLAMPDWRGNNRLDSLRNIVADGRVSLMFMVPGSTVVLRVNGRARISVAPALLASFARGGLSPRVVILVDVAEVYPQCAKALMRARIWGGADDTDDLPSMGDMLREASAGAVDADGFDARWPGIARETMW